MLNARQEAARLLEEKGIRASLHRIAVMQFLMENRVHPTAEEIYEALSSEIPTLSRTTVYNTLHHFADVGLALALVADEKNTRYDAELKEHAHFVCTRCGKLTDVFVQLPQAIREVPGAEVHQVHLYYRGLCPACSALDLSRERKHKN